MTVRTKKGWWPQPGSIGYRAFYLNEVPHMMHFHNSMDLRLVNNALAHQWKKMSLKERQVWIRQAEELGMGKRRKRGAAEAED
jgi:hypothetical protein